MLKFLLISTSAKQIFANKMFDSDDEEYLEYRSEARYWAEQADEYFRLSRNVYSSGDCEMAEDYYELAKSCQKCMMEANDTAADVIFEINNQNRPSHVIDLHKLFVNEAIGKLTDRVNDAIKRSVLQLIVIVGRGNHSVGEPKLKEAVANFAFKNNIRYELDHFNTGRINLHLVNISPIPLMPEDESEDFYKYNRSKKVTLSEYIPQAGLKDSTSQNTNRSQVPSSVRKSRAKRKDSTHNMQNSYRNGNSGSGKKHSSMHGNTTQESDRSNKVTPSVKNSETEIKDSTHVTHNANRIGNSGPHPKDSSMERKHNTEQADDCSNDVSISANTTQIQGNQSTYILQSGNGCKYRFMEIFLSILALALVLSGLFFLAKLCSL